MIFETALENLARERRSTKEGGIFPLQVRVTVSQRSLAGSASAQQRKGEYSPFKTFPRSRPSLESFLERSTKEGGIFPFKAASTRDVESVGGRSTKEGGIFPLQETP